MWTMRMPFAWVLWEWTLWTNVCDGMLIAWRDIDGLISRWQLITLAYLEPKNTITISDNIEMVGPFRHNGEKNTYSYFWKTHTHTHIMSNLLSWWNNTGLSYNYIPPEYSLIIITHKTYASWYGTIIGLNFNWVHWVQNIYIIHTIRGQMYDQRLVIGKSEQDVDEITVTCFNSVRHESIRIAFLYIYIFAVLYRRQCTWPNTVMLRSRVPISIRIYINKYAVRRCQPQIEHN